MKKILFTLIALLSLSIGANAQTRVSYSNSKWSQDRYHNRHHQCEHEYNRKKQYQQHFENLG